MYSVDGLSYDIRDGVGYVYTARRSKHIRAYENCFSIAEVERRYLQKAVVHMNNKVIENVSSGNLFSRRADRGNVNKLINALNNKYKRF